MKYYKLEIELKEDDTPEGTISIQAARLLKMLVDVNGPYIESIKITPIRRKYEKNSSLRNS